MWTVFQAGEFSENRYRRVLQRGGFCLYVFRRQENDLSEIEESIEQIAKM